VKESEPQADWPQSTVTVTLPRPVPVHWQVAPASLLPLHAWPVLVQPEAPHA
jgi:hypothetical protein